MHAGRSGRSSLVLGVADTLVTENGYVSDTRACLFSCHPSELAVMKLRHPMGHLLVSASNVDAAC